MSNRSPSLFSVSAPAEREIFSQEVFLRFLCLERKRSERSGRNLVLMLLESPLLQTAVRFDIARALTRSARETDIIGWYEEGSIMAVVFTEIVNVEGVAGKLEHRTDKNLCEALTLEQLNQVRLSFHIFPDDRRGDTSDDRSFSKLHPDVTHQIESRRFPLVVKRFIDLVGSALCLALLAPLMLLIAAAVKLGSPGPVLFRQKRLGQRAREFTFLKFRSMYAMNDQGLHEAYVKRYIADQAGNGAKTVYKIVGDPRITKIGALLRRTSLDELPQLFNVLAGQMSLVGPRPPVLYEFASYAEWHKRRLMAVKPGITGFWQVKGRSRVKFDDMVRMDLEYARSWSVWLDIKILLQTPRAVVSGDGAF